MPDIGEGIAEVELVAWHVKPGDAVVEDQALADVMTDKASVEIPSPVAGTVLALGGEVGQTLAVGSELIRIELAGGAGVACSGGRGPGRPRPRRRRQPAPAQPAAAAAQHRLAAHRAAGGRARACARRRAHPRRARDPGRAAARIALGASPRLGARSRPARR